MATNNLLVNNEYKVLHDEMQKIERSAHNLSQSRKFPVKVGYIYPFFCRKTLPSDSFKIWANILIKQLQPLLVPQMVSFTVNTAFYWVDYSLAFPEFEYFLINQKGQQTIELPYVSDFLDTAILDAIPNQNLHKNIRTYLDISRNRIEGKVDALPFWTYKTIIRDYYLNIDRLSDREYGIWFPDDPNDWKLKQGPNYGIGRQGNDVAYHTLDAHNVRGDYFVNSYPTPLRGDIPTLSIGTASDIAFGGDATITLRDNIGDLYTLINTYDKILSTSPNQVAGNGAPVDYNVVQRFGSLSREVDGKVDLLKSSNYSPSGDQTYFGAVEENFTSIQDSLSKLKQYLTTPRNGRINFSTIQSFDVQANVTTRQLRLLESLTRKREIDIMMKPRLKNYLQVYFGVNRYKDDSLYQPVFIGSTTQQILINDIAQTSATSDSPLGRQGATAISLGSGYVGEYYCRNYGCLMGLMYILPDYDYEPALPREWCERTPDDFVNPEFAHLSMQPILNKELFVSSDDTWNNEVLGYGGMYDSYRTSTNLVSGDLLNTSMTDVLQFAQVRRFDDDNKPEITSPFLNSAEAFDSSVFAVPSLPPFIAQCVARVEAVRPIPQIAIPRG